MMRTDAFYTIIRHGESRSVLATVILFFDNVRVAMYLSILLHILREMLHQIMLFGCHILTLIYTIGCMPEMFVTSYSVTYCIYTPGKPGICFHHCCAVYDECKYSDSFWLADRTRLFVQYTISLSSLCKLIWRHWTYKMPVRYILSSVWVRLSIFSLLSIIQYVGLYVFRLPISVVMIEIIYILCLIIIKSEVWTFTHCC